MKNAVTNKKKININDLIIYIGFGVITLFAVVFTLVVCAKPFKITKIDNIKEVDYSDYNDELPKLQKKAENYLERNIQGERIETSK